MSKKITVVAALLVLVGAMSLKNSHGKWWSSNATVAMEEKRWSSNAAITMEEKWWGANSSVALEVS